MTTTAMNPSDLLQPYLVMSPSTLASGVDVDLTTGIDMSLFEYILIHVSVGSTGGTLTVTPQHSNTLTVSGGGYTATGTAITLAATADNNLKQFELRTHGKKRYLNINAVTTVNSCVASIVVQGVGRQYPVNFAVLTGSTAELGLS